MIRFPRANKIFQFFFNLKRNIILVIIFASYFSLILLYPNSLINWGFFAIIMVLFGVQLLEENVNSGQKQRLWQVMIYYSSLAILVNLLFLLCQQKFILNLFEEMGLVERIPTWVSNNVDVIGLIVLTEDQLSKSQTHIFLPYLFFFISAVYVKNEIQKWAEDDKIFQ